MNIIMIVVSFSCKEDVNHLATGIDSIMAILLSEILENHEEMRYMHSDVFIIFNQSTTR